MNPGRELDALIAEKVMGFMYAATVNFKHEGKEETGVAMTESATFILPPYSTEISAAWQVMEKIEFRFTIIKERDGSNERRYKAFFSEGDEGFPVSYASTAPHVICLAALKAVGYENKS